MTYAPVGVHILRIVADGQANETLTTPPVGTPSPPPQAMSIEEVARHLSSDSGTPVGSLSLPESPPLDVGTLAELTAIAEGRSPLPGEGPQAAPPPTAYTPPAAPAVQAPATPAAPPAPDPVQQTLLLMQQQMAQQQQQFLQALQTIQQQHTPAPPSQVDRETERHRIMMQAGLDPRSRDDQFKFSIWEQQQELARYTQELGQYVQGLQQRAQAMTVEQRVAKEVDDNLSTLKAVLSPDDFAEVRADAIERASELAGRGDEKAVEKALRVASRLAKSIRSAPPVVSPPQSTIANPVVYQDVPAFAGQTPAQVQATLQQMQAISPQGRGAGRHQKPATIDDVTRAVSRRS